MAKQIVYTVRGKEPFPFDMLRYDASYPTDKGVQGLMEVYQHGYEKLAPSQRSRVEVELVCPHGSITPDRWASFGWPVITQEKRSY